MKEVEQWDKKGIIGQRTVNVFCEAVLSEGGSQRTAETHRQRLIYYQKYLAAINSSIEEATPESIAGYQAWLLEYTSQRWKRKLTVNTQGGLLHSVILFYRYLHRSNRLLSDPARHLKLPKQSKKLPVSILTPDEMRKLLKQPKLEVLLGYRDRTILEVLYSCGLRIGELKRLKEEDILSGERALAVMNSKGYKDRIVPLGKTATSFLTEYCQSVRPMLLKGNKETLFPNRFGNPIDTSGLLKKIHEYTKRAGIKKRVTVHTFRHTLATEMLRRGADLRHIQAILGHEKLETTQLYTHIVKNDLRRVQDKTHPREQMMLPEGAIRWRGHGK